MRSPKATKAEQITATEELSTYDHAFLTTEGVEHFTKPFGFRGHTYVHKANPTEPKGLTLKDGATESEGQDAARLAEEICRHLGVEYPEKFGRGSQLRVCCEALLDHLKA
jgi:hypothetical protein